MATAEVKKPTLSINASLTNEVLLTIVIDRLRALQSSPYASRENAIALTKLEESLMWLEKPARDRVARGVEGKSE